MRTLLEGWGCRVDVAADHSSALQALAGGDPDALVADYHLDHGDGLAAIKALRDALRPDLKAALLTADRTAELRDRAAAEDVAVLNKPVKPASLRAWLSQAGMRRPKTAERRVPENIP
jgi:CheY-like chemotaxis protein